MQGNHRLSTVVILSLITLGASSALGQRSEENASLSPKTLRHSQSETVKRLPAPTRVSKRLNPQSINRVCDSRRAVLEEERERLGDFRADLAGIEVEMAQLQRRLRELRERSATIEEQSKAQESRILRIEDVYKEECTHNETCEEHEMSAKNLEEQSAPLEAYLETTRKEISRTRTDMGQLRRKIRPLQRKHQSMNCGELIPGETSSNTIRKCASVFTQWNHLRTELNHHSLKLRQLKASYERTLTRLTNLERRAIQIEDFLRARCRSPKTLKQLHQHRNVRQRANNLSRELDELLSDLEKLREIKITLQPR